MLVSGGANCQNGERGIRKCRPRGKGVEDSRRELNSPRAAIGRSQAIFNSKPINITGVAGINDDVAAGGLVAGGIPLQGTCGTCHDTSNVGNHSFPTPLDIGTGDPGPTNLFVNMGGLDISYLPTIVVCKTDPATDLATSTCKTTTDLGQALIDGKFDHVGKIKGPILRRLSARAPYFHNGAAQTLLDAVRFYEHRFGIDGRGGIGPRGVLVRSVTQRRVTLPKPRTARTHWEKWNTRAIVSGSFA